MEFQTKTKLTEKEIGDYLHFWSWTVKGKVTRQWLTCLVLYLAALIYLTVSAEGSILDGIAKNGIVWGMLLGFFLTRLGQRRAAYKSLHVLQELECERLFRDKCIESSQPNIFLFYEYPAVSDVYHTRNCYYILLKNNSIMILPERCFTQGDPAAFGAFIAEKTGLEVKEIK